jgi:hypothetical protein
MNNYRCPKCGDDTSLRAYEEVDRIWDVEVQPDGTLHFFFTGETTDGIGEYDITCRCGHKFGKLPDGVEIEYDPA